MSGATEDTFRSVCPDCGNDPDDRSVHSVGCRRVFEVGDPQEYLQFGPPWEPWPECDAEVSR